MTLQAVRGNREVAARALVWTLLESFGLSGLSIIGLIVLSRYVGPEAFGKVSIALAAVQMLVVVVERLFHDPLIQRKVLLPRDSDSAFTATLVLSLLLTAGCWWAAPLLAHQLGHEDITPLLRWMCWAILFAGMSTVLSALHRRELAFKAMATRSLVARAAAAVIAIGLAVAGAGVWSIVAQQVLTAMLSMTVLWWLTAVPRPGLAWDARALREMFAMGLPSTLHQFVWIANSRLFILIVGAQLSAAQVGMIALAFRVVDMMRDLLGQAVSQLALPLFARVEREGGSRVTALVTAVRLTTSVMFPLFAGLAVMAPEVVELAFGVQWLAAAPFVSLLAVLSFHAFAQMFAAPLLGAVGRPGAALAGLAVQTVFVCGVLLAIRSPTPELALAVWAARLAVSIPIDMVNMKRLSGIGYGDQWRGAFTPALACAVCAAALLALRAHAPMPESPAWRLLLQALLGAAAYVGVLRVIDRRLLLELKQVFDMAVLRRFAKAG